MGGWKNLTMACCIAAAALTGCAPPEYPKPDPENEVVDAISIEEFEQAEAFLGDRKLALALIKGGNDDPALRGIEDHFANSFAYIPTHSLFTYRYESVADKLNAWRDFSLLDKVDTLIIADHGNESRFGRIRGRHVETILGGYSDTLTDNATVILYNCSTGALRNGGVSQRVADVLNRDTIAPRWGYSPQVMVHPLAGVREFVLNGQGQVTFNYEIFRMYTEGPVGPWSMGPVGVLDGEPGLRQIQSVDRDTMFFVVDK